ncbi:hypothetical protein YC2023_108969 [Brassica napus]
MAPAAKQPNLSLQLSASDTRREEDYGLESKFSDTLRYMDQATLNGERERSKFKSVIISPKTEREEALETLQTPLQYLRKMRH